MFRLKVVQGRFDALVTQDYKLYQLYQLVPLSQEGSTVLAQILGLRPEELQRLALQFGGWAIG